MRRRESLIVTTTFDISRTVNKQVQLHNLIISET